MMQRCVSPELLDNLSPSDARAIGSRRDLRRLNFCMGNARIMANVLSAFLDRQPVARVIDLGAGDGTFLLRVARACVNGARITVDLVDRQPTPSPQCRASLEQLGWNAQVIATDVFDWLATQPEADAILCNLFLHHFEAPALRRLLELAAQRCRIFIACEPRRSLLPLFTSRLLFLIGCNSVTRHDATVSVHAGFRDSELSAHWPGADWQAQERRAGLFTHLFTASRAGILPASEGGILPPFRQSRKTDRRAGRPSHWQAGRLPYMRRGE